MDADNESPVVGSTSFKALSYFTENCIQYGQSTVFHPHGGVLPYKRMENSSTQENHISTRPCSSDVHVVPQSSTTPWVSCSQKRKEKVNVVLSNASLWNEFEGLETEMVITPNGRRLFPRLSFCASDLKPDGIYSVRVEFKRADSYDYYKYSKRERTWYIRPDEEMHDEETCPLSVHPDSPATGQYWAGLLEFPTLLVFTKKDSKKSGIVLQSHRKYEPCLVITEHRSLIDLSTKRTHSFTFPQARFIAVTSYCDPAVAEIKTKFNPFALHARKRRRETLSPDSSCATECSTADQSALTTDSTLSAQVTSYHGTAKRQRISTDSYPVLPEFSKNQSVSHLASSPLHHPDSQYTESSNCPMNTLPLHHLDSQYTESSNCPMTSLPLYHPDSQFCYTEPSSCLMDSPTKYHLDSQYYYSEPPNSPMASTPLHHSDTMYYYPESSMSTPTSGPLYCPHHPYSSPASSCQCTWHAEHGNEWSDQDSFVSSENSWEQSLDTTYMSPWEPRDYGYQQGLLRSCEFPSFPRCG